MIDFGKRLEDRIDGILARRVRAVAKLRESYQAGRVIPQSPDWKTMRRNFGLMAGELRIAQRELEQWKERHPS